MKTGITVADAMTVKPVVVGPERDLIACAKLMRQKRVGSLIVKDGHRFVGIVTEQDIVRRGVAKGLNLKKTTINEIMSSDVILGSPDMDIFDALGVMRDYEVRHLPVVDEGRLLGLVTMKDILKIEPDLFDILVEKFEIAEESRKPVYHLLERDGVCQNCGKYRTSLKLVDGVLMCSKCR